MVGDGIFEDIAKFGRDVAAFSKKHRILGNANTVLNATPLGGLLESVPFVGKIARKGIRKGAQMGYGPDPVRGGAAGIII